MRENDIPKATPKQTPTPIPAILSSTFTKQTLQIIAIATPIAIPNIPFFILLLLKVEYTWLLSTDRISYYNAFDEYHVKHNLSAMEKLFAEYINARLDAYLKILQP